MNVDKLFEKIILVCEVVNEAFPNEDADTKAVIAEALLLRMGIEV